MLETVIAERKQQEALERIQNVIRNTKNGINIYLNDYVSGKNNVFLALGATVEVLKRAGERMMAKIEESGSAF